MEETKCKRSKVEDLADGSKLYYTRKNNAENGVGVVVDKDLKEKIVRVKRLGGRLIAIKLVLKKDVIRIISAYAPQARSYESVKSMV